MAAQWYYSHGGKTYGPVTSQQLRDLANRGMILPDDMVWKEGVAEGVPAKTVKGLFPDGSAASSPPTSTATTTPKGGSASVGWSGMASSSSSTGPSDFDDDDTDYRLMRKRKAYGKQLLLDYLFFRRMISPILIQIFFWVGAVGSVSVGLYFFVDGFIPQERGLARIINRSFDDDRDIRRFDNDEPLKITKQPIRAEKTINLLESFGGFLLIIFGPFFTRILCENMIVLFQINETLTDIRNQGL